MSLCCIFSNVTDVQEVYWVHWLQAQATFHRWEEELALTQNEMHWVMNYFTFWQKQWIGWAPVAHGGHLAYAKIQSAMWSKLAQWAHQLFSETWSNFTKDSLVFT